jgi:hypothetical protein
MSENIGQQLSSLKYEYEKVLRTQKNIEQNYLRKKRLNLLENVEEAEFKQDIEKIKRKIAALKREMLSLESQQARQNAIRKQY